MNKDIIGGQKNQGTMANYARLINLKTQSNVGQGFAHFIPCRG